MKTTAPSPTAVVSLTAKAVNLDASLPAPEVGKRLGIKVKRAKLFQLSEAQQ